MRYTIRSQAESPEEAAVHDVGVDCSGDEPIVRPEFAEGTETAFLLNRYGGQILASGFEPGEADFDLDLQGAYAAVQRAEETFAALPEEVRSRYANWREMWARGNDPVKPPEGSGKPPEGAQSPEGGSPPAGAS